VIFTIFVTRLGDIYGRKWLCWVSSALSIPIQLGFLLSKNLTLTTALFFLLGACTPGKLHISFVYLTELVPERHRTAVGTLVLFADASSMTLYPLYFRFVTKEWIYFQIGSLVMNIVGVIGMLIVIPESPKYLYASGRIKECIEKIRYIARVNGKGKEVFEIAEVKH
jgi:MFS family permease